jgi:hypothetical protein
MLIVLNILDMGDPPRVANLESLLGYLNCWKYVKTYPASILFKTNAKENQEN